MSTCARLVLFGRPGLHGPGGTDDPLVAGPGRRLALLALAVAAGPAGISRDRVVALLWPESDEERARHALAQLRYSLRRSSGLALIRGEAELRPDPASLTSDVADLEAAHHAGDSAEIVRLYRGPFLEGFQLPGAATEFQQWLEAERARFARIAGQAWESLARKAETDGDGRAAAAAWEARSALDPFDARVLVQLLSALARIGDTAGALHRAEQYAEQVGGRLGLPPDSRVVTLAERLREDATRPPASAAAPAAHAPIRRGTGRRLMRTAAAAALLLGVVGAASLLRHPEDVLAVGAVRYLGPDSTGAASELTDMLATSLGRLSGVQVLSGFRVRELAGRLADAPGAGDLAQAARAAGATDVLEGVVHPAPGGSLRFELRQVDLRTGSVRAVYRVDGRDPFELADSATARVAADYHVPAPREALSSVTTGSLVAYRLYDEGLAAWAAGDAGTAHRLFTAALREDSTFALAAYRSWMAALSLELPTSETEARLAERLAGQAPERERMFIQGALAVYYSNPGALALADSLVARYPQEPEGFTLLSTAALTAGAFERSVDAARTARRLLGPLPARPGQRCPQCDLYSIEVNALVAMDSLARAEQVAREWTRLLPAWPGGWYALGGVLDDGFRFEPALAAWVVADSLAELKPEATFFTREALLLRAARFEEVDRAMADRLRDTPDAGGVERWYLFISWRDQGRLGDALRLISSGTAGSFDRAPRWQTPDPRLLGQARLEAGDYRGALTAFAACRPEPGLRAASLDYHRRGKQARQQAWCLVHQATARAAVGDTASLPVLADSIERVGAASLSGRDVRLHHYVRGLLAAARRRDSVAAEEFRAAIYSPTYGFTRANLELGRALLRLNRPAEAIPVVRAALHGAQDASNLYVTHTELHELLADLFAAAGQRDSAAAQYRWVAAAWARSDPDWRSRRDRAERLAALLGQAGPRPLASH